MPGQGQDRTEETGQESQSALGGQVCRKLGGGGPSTGQWHTGTPQEVKRCALPHLCYKAEGHRVSGFQTRGAASFTVLNKMKQNP